MLSKRSKTKLRSAHINPKWLLLVAMVGFGGITAMTVSSGAESKPEAMEVGQVIITLAINESFYGTEYVDFSYHGAGSFDMTGIELASKGELIHIFEDLAITPEKSFRICSNARASYRCNGEWDGGNFFNLASGTLSLRVGENTLLSESYTATSSSQLLSYTLPVKAEVYDFSGKLTVCEDGNERLSKISKIIDQGTKSLADNNVAGAVVSSFYYQDSQQEIYFHDGIGDPLTNCNI